MSKIVPLPSVYFPEFIAANQASIESARAPRHVKQKLKAIIDEQACPPSPSQSTRADNVITGSKQQQLEHVRNDIREFKKANNLDKVRGRALSKEKVLHDTDRRATLQVIVLWTANTERFAAVEEGVNDTADALLAAIARDEDEISPSTLFAVACILEVSRTR